MITDEMIARINELYKKQKNGTMTPEEKEEQAKLRRAYVDSVKQNLKSQLDNVDVVEPDGSITNLGEEHKKRYGE